MRGTIARTVAIAVIGLAVAAAAFGRALHNAVRLDPVVPDPAATPQIGAAPAAEPAEPLSAEALQLAVQNDPFSENRRASSERYRMPGEMPAFTRPARERPPEIDPPEFTVIGTLAFADGGFVVVQTEDGTRRVISVGESHDGYRLDGVRGNTALLSRQDAEFSLRVPEPSPFPPQPRRGRNSRGRNNDDDDDERRGRNTGRNGGDVNEQRQIELQRVLESLRGRGAGVGLRGRGAGGDDAAVGYIMIDSVVTGAAVRGVRILRAGGGGGGTPQPDGPTDGR